MGFEEQMTHILHSEKNLGKTIIPYQSKFWAVPTHSQPNAGEGRFYQEKSAETSRSSLLCEI
jgi:hypothetical protein